MDIGADRQALLDEAQAWVKRFVGERGAFSMFALAKHSDGKVTPLQSTDEVRDMKSGLTELIRTLTTLARDGEISGCVICTPVSEGKDQFAIFDVEHKTSGRVLAFVPYKKRLLGGWSFGSIEFKADGPRIFAS